MLPSLFRQAVVANTDKTWFDHFRPQNGRTHIDEVNFWRPLAQTHVKAVAPGDPFFLRLKHPHNAIAGFGFFAVDFALPVAMAWDIFGPKNGATDFP